VQQHRVADGDVRDRGADLVHPARRLVAGYERQADARALPGLVELAVPDVDVGAAEAGGPDPDDHVGGRGDLRFRHLADLEVLAVAGELRSSVIGR
jgi:hypothetical protein